MIARRSKLPVSEFRSGSYRTVATPYFTLRVKKNSVGKGRVGVIVSGGVDKSAVKRNFWKRQAKAGGAAAAMEGKDVLIVVSPGARAATKRGFQKTLGEAFKKAKTL